LTLLLGHRGLNTVATENTLEAITAAADLGVDGVEIDVRPCQSGELVVFHDVTLERLANDDRAVSTLPLRALQAIDLEGSVRIPTLDQVLSLCVERNLLLNIEMKRDVPRRRDVVRLTAEAVARHRCRVIVSSFDPAMLAMLAASAPFVPRGLLISAHRRHRWTRHLARRWVANVHPHHRLATRDAVHRWHANGLRVMTWTVNDPVEARRLGAAGVDGIMTDRPAEIRAAIET
jgi:glycerophosphoryl diester phosphodiesterase